MNRKPDIKTQDIVVMYTVQHLSSGDIQKITGMSRTAIMNRLHKAIRPDVKLSEWVDTDCDYCGKEFKIIRSRWHKSTKHYCNRECYFARLENPNYRPHRNGQRLARAIVAQHFNLMPEHVVHHKDGDNKNNDLNNLSVYKNQSDHLIATHHNNSTVRPVWDGSTGLVDASAR